MKIYEKYILKEIVQNYLFFFIVFNLLFVVLKLIDFTDKIINNSVPLLSAIKLSLLLIPSFGIFTIPLITLSAILFTFSKFSATNEITALKTFGVSPFKLIKIPVIIGFVSFFLGIFNNLYVLPYSTKVFFNEVNNVLRHQTAKSLKPKSFNTILSSTIFYFNSFDRKNNLLKKVFIYDELNNQPEIIISEKGNIDISDNIIFLKLTNGKIHIKKPDEQYEIISFDNYILKFDLEKNIKTNINLKDKESSIDEINRRINYYKKIGDFKKVNYLKMEIYKRYSLPFAAVIFVFIGLTFGIRSSRNPKSWTFLIILAVVFLYYSIVMVTTYLTKNNIINPGIGAWLPNIIIGILTGFALYLTIKEKIKT